LYNICLKLYIQNNIQHVCLYLKYKVHWWLITLSDDHHVVIYCYNFSNKCSNCWNESARAQWFRHSDGWRCGSSTAPSWPSSSASNAGVPYGSFDGHHAHHHIPTVRPNKRSAWESLPSLRHENSVMTDNGYKSNINDLFEQR